MAGYKLTLALVVIILNADLNSGQSPNALDSSLKVKLTELRSKVGPLSAIEDEHLLGDQMLLKWLQARNENVDEATEMMRNTLNWRKEFKIENILNEDFTTFEKLYPFLIDGVDNDGHPIILIPGGSFDIRKAVIGGHSSTLLRYFVKNLEYGISVVLNTTAAGTNPDAKAVIILDLSGFSLAQNWCLRCIPLYLRGLTLFEANYPRMFKRLFSINSPRIIQEMFELLKPVLSEDSIQLTEIHGFNKDAYGPALLKHIPADQLPIRYGGTRQFELSNVTGIVGSLRF